MKKVKLSIEVLRDKPIILFSFVQENIQMNFPHGRHSEVILSREKKIERGVYLLIFF